VTVPAPALASEQLNNHGRWLPQEGFDHLIPQRALRHDPATVKSDQATPKNIRAGNLLLCKAPLRHEGSFSYPNGCNSWKGRFYDGRIEELISGDACDPKGSKQVHIIAGLCLSYLAMVAEFGYVITLMQSGVLMREQFFSPDRFRRELPIRSQMILGATINFPPDAPAWSKLFSFGMHDDCCVVATRIFAVTVPVSCDPRQPLAKHLRIVPYKYKLRPDFQ
jgi:hypothetical protein